jgi:hypothetical protein
MTPLQIISLGAGVQSSTMALMAAAGEITPMPDAAIFADTGAEPKEVYQWLDWLMPQLPFDVIKVKANGLNLTESQLLVRKSKKTGHNYVKCFIPSFLSAGGLLGRKCTTDFKVVPVRRAMRKLAGIHGKSVQDLRVVQWLGISLDEIQRMKTSVEPWMQFRHPLIEDKRMLREDCLKWMNAQGYPEPPRSACTYCPFHSNEEWRRVKASDDWESVVQFERDLQAAMKNQTNKRAAKGTPYLHRSCQPIDEVDFGMADPQMDMFNNECAGMCGV